MNTLVTLGAVALVFAVLWALRDIRVARRIAERGE